MRSTSTRNLVLNALFVALVFLLGMTPIGIIPLGAINVTILHIPVIAGTLFMGLKSGLLLGFVFGLCSTLSAFGLSLTAPSALAAALGAKSPILLVAMCFIPRLLVPTVTWYVKEMLAKDVKKPYLPDAVAAILGSVTNTVFYLSLMVVFYSSAGLDVNFLIHKLGINGLNFFGFIGVIASGAGGLEALAACFIIPPIVGALNKVKKLTFGSY
ncbi:MAG: ECF transporter S component [Clostridia bacterium]|nr:ECF transporter S component [Clostridia bacterium]MBQ5769915.1 ECF transporter S component [Clostridia bacterium]